MLRPFNSLFFAWWYQLMLLLPPSMPAGASFTLNPHSDTHLTIWDAHHLSDCKFTTYTFNSPHKQSHWTEVSLIGGLSSIKKPSHHVQHCQYIRRPLHSTSREEEKENDNDRYWLLKQRDDATIKRPHCDAAALPFCFGWRGMPCHVRCRVASCRRV